MRKIVFALLVAALLVVIGVLLTRTAHATTQYTWEFRLEGETRWSYGGSFSSGQGCQTFSASWTAYTGKLIAAVRIKDSGGNVVPNGTLLLNGGSATWCPPSTTVVRPWWQRWWRR